MTTGTRTIMAYDGEVDNDDENDNEIPLTFADLIKNEKEYENGQEDIR